MTTIFDKALADWSKQTDGLVTETYRGLRTRLHESSEVPYTAIADLSPEDAAIVLKAFAKLADDQRGKPEDMGGAGRMGANPGLSHATGVYTNLTEHIGDLTHRMSQRYCQNMSYGYEMVLAKVERGLRYLNSPYGFQREVESNLKGNFQYQSRETPDFKWRGDFVGFCNSWLPSCTRYADAHAELVVYNAAQYHARQAAIELGNRDGDAAIRELSILQSHLSSYEQWAEYAGRVRMGPQGPIPMTHPD